MKECKPLLDGLDLRVRRSHRKDRGSDQGRAVQVNPIKPRFESAYGFSDLNYI
jgi:hypothetical protein